MKKCFLCIALLLLVAPLPAQHGNIETDIFGDLVYRSNGYTATLKKNIFDDLTYSDNQNNNIVFEKKYLQQEAPKVLSDNSAKMDIFRYLIRKHRSESGFSEKYSVDIFGTTIIEDNRGNKVEMGTDIFGNPTYDEKSGGVQTSISRSLNGMLEYRSGGESASLGKDVFNKWTYRDSSGNKFEFGDRTWDKLIRRFGNDENVFRFLVDEFMRN